ncbi:BglG family transcription antiterminator LicT [Paenibacillus kribbensis]|uniref:BglG family transcription antiterminator LicT n=1 Tax=Paenibacillus kribbensis TaxID=172713 RepID=UPI000839485C|nr:PRD domain-containing protein [Paenibacillus kribbensis]
MRIKKVFNNNVALVENQNFKEMIVMGKAIGFQKYPGDVIDGKRIEKTFVLDIPENTDKLISLFNEIPSEDIALADEMINFVQPMLKRALNESTLIALSDHISFALKRAREGIEIKNPLLWEIKQVYPLEFDAAKRAIDLVQKGAGVEFPEGEVAFLALHFVNGQLDDGPEHEGMELAGIISKILDIVKYHYQVELDDSSLNFTRFVTHLRYFIQRQSKGEIAHSEDVFLHDIVKDKYPRAYKCSLKIKQYLDTSYGWSCSLDELLYLTVHIHRLTSRLVFEEE